MAKLAIKKASTDVTTYLFIQASNVTTGAGLTGLTFETANLVASYVRPGAARAAITLATLAAADSAHSDGGFKEVDATNMPGIYRLDLPDAVCATGVNSVVVMLKGATNMAPVVLEVQLVSYDPNDAVRLGITALPNAAAGANGGLPTTNGTKVSQTVDLTAGQSIAANGGTVATATNLTNLPTMPSDWLTAAGIKDDAVTKIQSGLATPTSVLAATVEGTYSVQEVLRIMVSALAGKVSGGNTTTITFRDLSDTLDMIAATVDANGNRSAVTITLE
jgi:hypothetical protein